MRITVNYNNPLTSEPEGVMVLIKPASTGEDEMREKGSYTVGRLLEDASRRLSAAVGEKVELVKLTNAGGATLLPEDEVADYVEDGEQLAGFTKSQLDKKQETAAQEKEKDEKKGEEDDAGELKGFSVTKKMVKVCDGEFEEQTLLTIEDHDLRSAINQFASDDTFYEDRPQVDPETLLCHLPQFKSNSNSFYQQMLEPLVAWLEKRYKGTNDKIERMLQEQKISYNALWFLFNTGKKVWGTDSGLLIAGEVKTAKYMRGFFPGLLITAKVIKSSGQAYLNKDHQFFIPMFAGAKKLEDLPVQILTDELEAKLTARGKLFQALALGAHYKVYSGHMLFRTGWCVHKYKADGRIMIDGVSFNRINPGYEEFTEYNSFRTSADLAKLSEDQLWMTWPTLPGFSFTAKKWGEVIVDNVADVVFDDKAFDRLVLAKEKKTLIKSLVANNSTAAFSDVISGKGGGCIFLLHGKPGVGKTLTAEAIAELLHRPLYSVSVGELGTSTDQLEARLKEILEVASSWDAVILIDEADIFLERRSENDIKRNAMVGIFLRLLEYHQGVLFLTTNRVKSFDSAFHSRISIALKYSDLDFASRRKIWANLLDAASVDLAQARLDLEKLAAFELNGRQIRTVIRLALSLAQTEGDGGLTEAHIERTINVSLQFKHDLDSMAADDCL